MSFSYTIERDQFGKLRAETTEGIEVKLPDGTEVRGYHVTLETYKGSKGVTSHARVYRITGDGFVTTDLFGDWHEDLCAMAGRGTEKVIRAAHETALTRLADALVRAKAHTELRVAREHKQEQERQRTEPAGIDAAEAMADPNYVGSPMHY